MSKDFRGIWDFSDPAGSEARFRSAAAAASGNGRALLETQVARALGLQDRFEEGHAVLDALEPDHSELGVRVALERGRLLRSSGDVAAARPLFVEAARLASDAALPDLHVDALHMVALTEPTPEDQVAANRAALEIARDSSDPGAQRWSASLLNNLGCALVDAGRPEEALPVFEEAVREREQRDEPRETQIARWMVGWTLRLLGRTDEAWAVQSALKAELEAAGIEDPDVDEELALLHPGE